MLSIEYILIHYKLCPMLSVEYIWVFRKFANPNKSNKTKAYETVLSGLWYISLNFCFVHQIVLFGSNHLNNTIWWTSVLFDLFGIANFLKSQLCMISVFCHKLVKMLRKKFTTLSQHHMSFLYKNKILCKMPIIYIKKFIS